MELGSTTWLSLLNQLFSSILYHLPQMLEIFSEIILRTIFFSCEENPFSYVLARVREGES